MPCPTVIPTLLTDMEPRLTRLARHLTGNPDLAQDLCQEVLLKLWVRLQDGAEIDDIPAYARTALRNQYRQHLRGQVPLADLSEVDHPAPTAVSASLAVRELATAIDELPAPQARLMRLVAEGETSPRSLAARTGWPLGTVMSRLARARARLRLKVGLGRNAPTAELL